MLHQIKKTTTKVSKTVNTGKKDIYKSQGPKQRGIRGQVSHRNQEAPLGRIDKREDNWCYCVSTIYPVLR